MAERIEGHMRISTLLNYGRKQMPDKVSKDQRKDKRVIFAGNDISRLAALKLTAAIQMWRKMSRLQRAGKFEYLHATFAFMDNLVVFLQARFPIWAIGLAFLEFSRHHKSLKEDNPYFWFKQFSKLESREQKLTIEEM